MIDRATNAIDTAEIVLTNTLRFFAMLSSTKSASVRLSQPFGDSSTRRTSDSLGLACQSPP